MADIISTMTSANTTTADTTTDMAATPTNIIINITFNGNDSSVMTAVATTLAPAMESVPTSPPVSPTTSDMLASTITSLLSTTSTSTTTASNTWLGLSMSNTLLIAVFTGCTALILCVLCVICCRLLCVKNKRDSSEGGRVKRQASRQQGANHYADPRVMENHYHSNDVTKFYATPELTYARPEIYSTFINPSFYEDVYARWKIQEQSRFESNYDAPHQYSRRLKEQMETPGFRWSAGSLRVLDSYDYDTYGRIPRGRIMSVDKDREDTETMATDTPEFTTF